ncbi:polysaccharide deacetylase family protein [Lysinibacillus sp. 54212]|uniref:polysaccharide deacetylase family protein n=1 Tax=Lysinibacillus sp. 54212 TaxID=3119829 RepID=UPI002FC81F1F
MTKKTKIVSSVIVLLGIIVLFFALTSKKNILIVDDKIKGFEQEPIIDDEFVYVPLSVIEKLYNVTAQHKGDKQWQLTINDKTTEFDLISKEIIVNGEEYSDPLKVEEDKIMLPNTFIEEHYNLVASADSSEVSVKSKSTIPILMYHTVNERPNDTINTQPERFEEHLKALSEANYNGITPFQLYDYYFNQKDLPENPILITLDDGYRDNYTTAYPILKKYGLQATVFVIASRIEHEGVNNYPNEIPKFKWEEAHEMKDYITIQSHTWDSHRKIEQQAGKDIGQIAAPQKKSDGTWETREEYVARITKDISAAQDIIREKMGYESVIISYPYGESSEEVREIASELGAKIGVTVKKGVNYSYESLMQLNRITVDGNFTGEELVKIIQETK